MIIYSTTGWLACFDFIDLSHGLWSNCIDYILQISHYVDNWHNKTLKPSLRIPASFVVLLKCYAAKATYLTLFTAQTADTFGFHREGPTTVLTQNMPLLLMQLLTNDTVKHWQHLNYSLSSLWLHTAGTRAMKHSSKRTMIYLFTDWLFGDHRQCGSRGRQRFLFSGCGWSWEI